jgi:hypothetical protein
MAIAPTEFHSSKLVQITVTVTVTVYQPLKTVEKSHLFCKSQKVFLVDFSLFSKKTSSNGKLIST